MILECPSCQARYLVQIGNFAQGGRQVRCARCKHEWFAAPPANVDIVAPPSPPPPPPRPAPFSPSTPPPIPAGLAASPQTPLGGAQQAAPTPNLPAVIKKRSPWLKWFIFIVVLLISLLAAGAIVGRQAVVAAYPPARDLYEQMGLHIARIGEGLIFDQVKSELRFDSGTMQLFVDGVIHNTTSEIRMIPDIRARALGPDEKVIQSWWIAAPSPTVDAGADVPFHTEVSAPMKKTIENVNLEFYVRDKDSAGNNQ